MSKITKQRYDELKAMPEEYLSAKNRQDIFDYETQDAGGPSNEELRWATDILNTANPIAQRKFQENGKWDKAMSIINQSRATREVKKEKGYEQYVKPVKSTPDDIQSNYEFNWKDAYENEKGEELRETEADAEKLENYIQSKMFEETDPSTLSTGENRLKKNAYDMKMYNPNTMKWSDFINSEQGSQYKKYLKDVQKYQQDKRLNDIWEGKDDETMSDKFATGAVNFMLPVTKEYAKKNYDKINSVKDIAAPLAFDVGSNVAMMGYPSNAVKGNTAKFLLSNTTAPILTEAGQVVVNDKGIPTAIIDAGGSIATNLATPTVLEGSTRRLSNYAKDAKGGSALQKKINEAANESARVQKEMKAGTPVAIDKDFFVSVDKKGKPVAFDTPESIKEINKVIPEKEYENALENSPLVRSGLFGTKTNKVGELTKGAQDKAAKLNTDDLYRKMQKSLSENGDLSGLTASELRLAGKVDKESWLNWLRRNAKDALDKTPQVKNYLINAAGRPQFGNRLTGAVGNIFGTDALNYGKQDTKEDKIQRVFGKHIGK